MRIIDFKCFNKFLLISFLSSSSMSSFAGWESGNTLYQKLTSQTLWENAMATGFIAGVFDGYATEQNWDNQAHYICMPDNATKQQLSDTVKKYLEDNPQDRHFNAASIVLNALSLAYPCN